MIASQANYCLHGRWLVLRAGAIGDFIVSLPGIGALRAGFPGWEMFVVGNAAAVWLALRRGYASDVAAFDETWVSLLFHPDGHSSPILQERLVDVRRAVVWLRDSDGVLVRNLSRMGIEVLWADPSPAQSRRNHISDHLLSTLSSLGVDCLAATPQIELSSDELLHGERLRRELGLDGNAPMVALHPGSGGASKCWPADQFARLAEALSERLRVQIVVIVGPADTSQAKEMLRTARVAALSVAQPSDLVELAGLLARCQCYVGNDSGVTHLAAVLGVPTVAIFGPTDPIVWAPRGQRVRLVTRPTDCAPCDRGTRQSCRDRRCLLGVQVDDVLEAVAAVH